MFKVTKEEINKGFFPLNHDCILKVYYLPDCPVRFEYFTCSADKCGAYSLMLQTLSIVHKLEIHSVDKFEL